MKGSKINTQNVEHMLWRGLDLAFKNYTQITNRDSSLLHSLIFPNVILRIFFPPKTGSDKQHPLRRLDVSHISAEIGNWAECFWFRMFLAINNYSTRDYIFGFSLSSSTSENLYIHLHILMVSFAVNRGNKPFMILIPSSSVRLWIRKHFIFFWLTYIHK